MLLRTWRAALLGTLVAAGALAVTVGEAEARKKRAPAAQSQPSSGCCPTCICGGLIGPAEAKRSQRGQRPPSQVSPSGVR